MLDQNTDRMWFVIGAVIVGAAIIFIANGTLPTLFASVSDSFEDAANQGTSVMENLEGLPDGLRAYKGAKLDVSGYPAVLRISTLGNNGGVYFDSTNYKANTTYALTFTFKKVSGELVHIAGHSKQFWADNDYYLDGVYQGNFDDSYLEVPQNVNDGLEHSVRVVFRTADEELRYFEDWHDSLFNNDVHIQPNRDHQLIEKLPSVEVDIYDLKFEEVL